MKIYILRPRPIFKNLDKPTFITINFDKLFENFSEIRIYKSKMYVFNGKYLSV